LPPYFPLMRGNALLAKNTLSAPIAFHSNPEGHSRAKPSAISFLSRASAMASGRFRRERLVVVPTCGALE